MPGLPPGMSGMPTFPLPGGLGMPPMPPHINFPRLT
jgi:hypothetical protein